jgi:hypothetical protein
MMGCEVVFPIVGVDDDEGAGDMEGGVGMGLGDLVRV